MTGRSSFAALIALVTIVCAGITVALFDRAYPLVDVGLRLSRDEAVAHARTVAATEHLAPPNARAAARFESNDTLSTYVDLAAGGADSLRAIVRGRDVAMYTWAVRLFEPGSPREVVIRFAPDGRLVGVDRTLAQAERRPPVSDTAGRAAADEVLARWGGQGAAWRLISSSYVTRPQSGRIDRTYTYERAGRRIGAAPVRAEVVVTGDSVPNGSTGTARGVPLGLRTFAEIPEAFLRRYGEMRSANDLYATATVPAMGLFLVAAFAALVKLRDRGLRWRPAALVGGVIGFLFLVVGLDGIPGAWFDYDTATSPTTFVAQLVIGAVTSGAGAGLFVTVVVAAAEALTRRALPQHYDWWGYWRHRGSSPIATRVLGGYALAAFGFAYVTLFYIVTRRTLGWWVPTGTLDDPNQIASPLPWATALGMASFAGVWEESIFRAVPLALLTLWAARRAHPRRWMAVGVVVTALVFGFGHANYTSWPAYSRGVELFLEASLWAVLYLQVGLPTTIVAHALYDLTWFGLFSLHGTGIAYRTTFAVVLATFLLPAAAVAQGWIVRRRAVARGVTIEPPPRFADWHPGAVEELIVDEPIADVPLVAPSVAPVRSTPRWAALAVIVLALGVRLGWPRAESLGPPFSASPARVVTAADSALRARGADPSRWRHFTTTDSPARGDVRRFLGHALGEARAARAVASLASSYLPTVWWEVRYAHIEGSVAERAEEWRVRVLPDGRVLDVTRFLPEAAPGASPNADSARALAARALDVAGVSRATLREVNLEQAPRPARLDSRIEYEDAAVKLPDGASARVRVALAGDAATQTLRRAQLPEAFERAERERASRRSLVLALGAIAGIGLMVTCIVLALRRPFDPHTPPLVDRRLGVTVGVVAALATLVTSANALPALLAAWPTEQPWSTYLLTSVLSATIAAGATGVGVGALWSLTDSLRRRTGIQFWPATATSAVRNGVALGLGITAVQFAAARLAAGAWPVARQTSMDRLVPWLNDALGVVPGALVVPTAAIIGLALAGALRRSATRWIAVLVVVLGASVIAAIGADEPAAVAGTTAASLTAIALLARLFGNESGASWVFAALAVSAATAARDVIVAETTVDAVSGTLGIATAAVLGVVLWRTAKRRTTEARRPGAQS